MVERQIERTNSGILENSASAPETFYHGNSGPLDGLPIEIAVQVASIRGDQQKIEVDNFPSDDQFEKLETSLTFNEIRTKFGYKQGPDGRWHIPFTPQLLAVRLQNGPEFEDIKEIYGRLHNGWEDFVTVDSPSTPEVQQATLDNKLQAIEARSQATTPEELAACDAVEERLRIIDILGADVGMAAHSERVAALVSTFCSLHYESK